MRIARFTHDRRTRLGVVVDDTVVDVGTNDPGLPPDVGALLAGDGVARVRAATTGAPHLPLDAVRLEAPIVRPPEFLAIGINYLAHAAETGRDRPERPIVFNKQSTCINGPFDPIVIPDAAPDFVDYEGELGVVIGRACRKVRAADAPSVVAGFLVVDDVSVRDWQRATPTMTMGKSWDTHGPIGPWLVTSDEVPDPHALRLRTWVDGELRQDASTSQLMRNCWELIEHLTTAFTLLPGTIIATGTPAGVGIASEPPRCLRPGQTVRIEIEGVGAIENVAVAETDAGR